MDALTLFISGSEIFIILLVVLLLFGANKLPEIARGLGKGMNEFKRATRDIRSEFDEHTQDIQKDVKDIKENIQEQTRFDDDFFNTTDEDARESDHSSAPASDESGQQDPNKRKEAHQTGDQQSREGATGPRDMDGQVSEKQSPSQESTDQDAPDQDPYGLNDSDASLDQDADSSDSGSKKDSSQGSDSSGSSASK